MIDQTCKICGAKFIAKQSNYTLCSEACRKVNVKNWKRINYDKIKDKHKEYSRLYRMTHKSRKGNPCFICGRPLPDSRAKFCLDCLFKEYQAGKTKWAYKVLVCRGYDRDMINDAIAQMR